MTNEEGEHMEDQVVPEVPVQTPSSSIHHQLSQMLREEASNTLDPPIQTLYLKNPLTLDMLLSIERKFYHQCPKGSEQGRHEHTMLQLTCPPKIYCSSYTDHQGEPLSGTRGNH